MPLVPIVDINDNVIGHKERRLLNFNDDICRAASVWITNSQGDILIAQRSPKKRVGGSLWGEAVGGIVDKGDTYLETAIREAHEEIGIVVDPSKLTVATKEFMKNVPATFFVQWYEYTIDLPADQLKLQEEEVAAVKWIAKQDLTVDVQNNPNKYITAMPHIIRLFT